MRMLFSLFKVVVALAILIPLGFLAFGLAMGLVGMVMGLVFIAVKLACLALVAYGLFRAAKFFFGSKDPAPVRQVQALPPRDPYYEAAMRELDSEMGTNR